MALMKTTVEISDPLFRRAKARAAERGQSLKDFIGEALQAHLASDADRPLSSDPKWMSGFGKLQRLRKETTRVQALIDAEFETVGPEERA